MNNQEILYEKVGRYLTEHIKESHPHIIEIVFEKDAPTLSNSPMNLICYMDPLLCGPFENHQFQLRLRYRLKSMVRNYFNIDVFEVYQKFILGDGTYC
jgi:hypothetical protein